MKNKLLLLLLLAGLAAGCRFGMSKDNDDNGDDKSMPPGAVVSPAVGGVYSLDNKAGVKTAQLNLQAGAMEINLSDGADKLFNAVLKDSTRKFILTQQSTDSAEVVNFISRARKHKFHNDSTTVDMRLNPNVQWGINAKIAAASCDFDLSKFRISKLGLHCAAGELKVKLAPLLTDTYVEINASVADITIRIPQDAACEVHTESALASNDFPGFEKKNDDRYETSGFASAKNKIHIEANCSLSSFKIERY